MAANVFMQSVCLLLRKSIDMHVRHMGEPMIAVRMHI